MNWVANEIHFVIAKKGGVTLAIIHALLTNLWGVFIYFYTNIHMPSTQRL